MVEQLKRIVGKVEVRTLTVLSVLVLLVVIGWSYAQLTGASNTVGSYDDLVNRYLDYRERSYMLCVPSWYLLADQVEAIDSQYGLAGFQDQPDWYVNFNMGELAIEPDSSLAALVADGTRLILYEDMLKGELLVIRDTGTTFEEEIVYKSPKWPKEEKSETAAAYLIRELSKRRVVWHVTLRDEATAQAETQTALAPVGMSGSEMLLLMSGGSCTQIVFTGIEKPVTNDTVDLGFCIPDGITNIDIFVASEPPLSGHPWELTATNVPVVSNSVIWSWSGLSISNLVFAAGDGSVDTDMDGLKDAVEFYVTGTEMSLWDSDGDGVNDGIEWATGTDPNDPNAPPNINGAISYAGLQTNAIIVIAALDSNSWYSAYSTTMGGVGSYQIANVPATSLYVKAYRDLNGNGLRDAEEAIGWYLNNPVEATGMVLGVNITLEEPDTDGDGVSDYTETTIFRTSPEDAADIPQQLTRASVSCYYGYGSGNTNWHYQEGLLGLTKRYSLGSGWVVSNVFLPDLSHSSAAIKYGEALGIGSHLSGGWIYATDTTLDHDVSMSKGWLWGEGYLTDYREPSEYIYYLQPNDDDFPDLFTFSQYVSSNPGKDSVGHGWTTPGSFTPDLTQVASQIYQGLANAHGYSTNLAHRHILPASETSGYKKGQLGTGWASPAGYIPNTSVSRTYYYGVYDDALGVSGYSSSTLSFGFNSYITLGSGYLAGNNFIPNPATQGGPPISSYDQNGDGFIDIPMSSSNEFARIDDSPLLLLDVTIGDASGSHTELYGFDLDDFSFDMPYVNQNEYLFTHEVPLERGQTYSGTLRNLPDDDDDGDYTFLVGGALHGPDTNLTYSGQAEPGVVVQAGFPHSGEQDTNIFGYVNDSGFNSGSKAFTVIVPRVNIRAHSAGTYQSAGTEITSFHEYLPDAVVLPVSTGTVGSVLSTDVTMSALVFEKFLPTSLDEGVLKLMISDTNVLALYDSSNKRILPTEYDLDTGSITNPLRSLTLYDRTFHAVGMNPGSASVTLQYLDVNGTVVCSDTVAFGVVSITLVRPVVNSQYPANNNYVFDNSVPGVCRVACIALVSPDTPEVRKHLQGKLKWSIESVPGSTLTWEFGGTSGVAVYDMGYGGWRETAIFTGLPEQNSSFGDKVATLEFEGNTYEGMAQVFYSKDAKNHPGSQSGQTPNWYYYWSQSSANSGSHTYGGNRPGLAGQVPYTGPNAGTVFIFDGASMTGAGYFPQFQSRTYIDCFASVVRHELKHQSDYYANWNPYSFALDADANGGPDLLKDSVESSLIGMDGNSYDNTERDTNGDGVIDGEDYASTVENSWTVGSADSEDWASPGNNSTK